MVSYPVFCLHSAVHAISFNQKEFILQVKKVKLPITSYECLQQKWFDQNQWKEHVLHSSLRTDTLEKAGKAQESMEDDKTQCLSGKRCQDPRLSCILNICRKCRRVAFEACHSPCIACLVLWKFSIPIGNLGIRSYVQSVITQFHPQDWYL